MQIFKLTKKFIRQETLIGYFSELDKAKEHAQIFENNGEEVVWHSLMENMVYTRIDSCTTYRIDIIDMVS